MTNITIPQALRTLRNRARLSMAEVARRAGWKTASSYQHYEDERLFTKAYLPRDIAEKIAGAFVGEGNPPIERNEVLALAGETAHVERVQGLVEIIAVVEAGVWREAIELPAEEREHAPWPFIAGFERMQVFALRVRGSSMNEVYPDGSVAYFVKPHELPPVDGSIVVVAATRGGLYETTLKELRVDPSGKRSLWPRSTDPRHQQPVKFNGKSADSVEIIGVAIGKFETLPNGRRPSRT